VISARPLDTKSSAVKSWKTFTRLSVESTVTVLASRFRMAASLTGASTTAGDAVATSGR